MQSQEQDNRVLPLIWFAIVVSLFIYGLVGWFVLRTPRPGAEKSWQEWIQQPVVMVLYFAGVTMFFASLIVPKYVLASGAAAGQPPRVRQAFVIRWAIAESGAVFGLVVAFLTGHLELMLPLWAVSLVAIMIAFPSEATIAAMEER